MSAIRACVPVWFWRLLAVMGLVMGAPSLTEGLFINPAPGVDPLPNTTHPAVGIVGDNLGAGGAFQSYCSGSLIASNIVPARSWVLTAGHCVVSTGTTPTLMDNQGRFQVSGPGGAIEPSDRVRAHTNYVFPPGDLGMFRLTTAVSGVTPLTLRRSALAAGAAFTAVGFGNTGFMAGMNTGFGTKREATFTIAAVGTSGPAGNNNYTFNNGAAPNRQLCQGDSGGPSLFTQALGGVHSFVTNPGAGGGFSPCDGLNTSNGDADVTQPFHYNWIDSYSRQSVFWDQLELAWFPAPAFTPVVLELDTFETAAANRGLDVLSPGWVPGTATMHPMLGLIAPDAGPPLRYRYMNAIGTDNAGMDELYTDSTSSQGLVQLNGQAQIIERTFMVPPTPMLVPTNICVRVQQRWNSQGLGIDVGMLVPNSGSLTWGGLVYSVPGDLDTWMTRGVCNTLPPSPVPQTVVVKLLQVPEPEGLLILGALSALLKRRRPPCFA